MSSKEAFIQSSEIGEDLLELTCLMEILVLGVTDMSI